MTTQNERGETCGDDGQPVLHWGPPLPSEAQHERDRVKRVDKAMRERKPRDRIGDRRALHESIAAIQRHLDNGAGSHEPEPKCPLCSDTGWQELPNGDLQRCWSGCSIPPKPGAHQEREQRVIKEFFE